MRITEYVEYFQALLKEVGDVEVCLVSEDSGYFRFDFNLDAEILKIDAIDDRPEGELVLGIWREGLIDITPETKEPHLKLIK